MRTHQNHTKVLTNNKCHRFDASWMLVVTFENIFARCYEAIVTINLTIEKESLYVTIWYNLHSVLPFRFRTYIEGQKH